jgi:hypothetical protein
VRRPRLKTLALLGGAAYAYSKGPRDPRQWAGFLAEEAARTKQHAVEAADAGKRASARKRAQIDREIADAYRHLPEP